jgi:hypothetical protein
MVQALALFSFGTRIAAKAPKYPNDAELRLTFPLVMGALVLFATFFIAVGAAVWASVYVALGAVPDFRRAILYSLEAMTTFGHADVYLTPHWQFLGALESLNGVILIGLTTAFIFSVIRGAEIRSEKMR